MKLRMSTWAILAAVVSFSSYKAVEHFRPDLLPQPSVQSTQVEHVPEPISVQPGPLGKAEAPRQVVEQVQLKPEPVQETPEQVLPSSKAHDRGLDAIFGKK